MPIGNLGDRISSEDLNKVKKMQDPDALKEGYEEGNVDDPFDDLFSDDIFSSDDGGSGLGDLMSADGSGQVTGIGGIGGAQGAQGVSGIGGIGGIGGGNSLTLGGIPTHGAAGNGFPANNATVQAKPDALDLAFDAAMDTSKTIGTILVDMVKSFKLRNCDDVGYFGKNMIMTGAVCACASVVLMIFKIFSGIKAFGITSLGGNLLLCGGMCIGAGSMFMGASSFLLSGKTDNESNNIQTLPDVNSVDGQDNSLDDLESVSGDMFDDLCFGDIFGDEDSDDDFEDENDEPELRYTIEKVDEPKEPVKDYNKALENIKENTYLTRETLISTFVPLLPTNNTEFSKKKAIEADSELFLNLNTICCKAVANVIKCEVEEVKCELNSVWETFFSYEMKLSRVKGLSKTDVLASELEFYFRETSEDKSVNATVTIEGDFYKIIVTKGVKAVVTLGDAFSTGYVKDFFSNTSKKIPIMLGVDELGTIRMDDAKDYTSLLIFGKGRAGKSWYVLSLLMCLMGFNTPEDCCFVIIDPKETNLFKTIALMPHVIGLHNEDNINEILDDIIEIEVPRRRQLLANHRCDDIWALRDKGIRLPVMYIFIDEFITVVNKLEQEDPAKLKELRSKILTIMTQFPSLGIYPIIIAHRATGILDKTSRTLFQAAIALKAETNEVKETLGISKWTKPLVNPGDAAMKSSFMSEAIFVRGLAVTTSDAGNTDFIVMAAKAFYKMGVDIPDYSYLRIACNRDEDFIKSELNNEGTNRVQYNASNVLEGL